MEKLGTILQKAIPQNDSIARPLTISEITELPIIGITPGKARELGFGFSFSPPKEIQCEFCERTLVPIGRRAMMKAEIVEWTGWQKCICAESAKHQKKLEAEKEKQRIEEKESARKALLQERVRELFDMSQLGKRFITRTFDSWKQTPINQQAYESAKKYVDNFDNYKEKGIGLMMSGTKGTGKTHLAAAITIELINQGTPVIMNTMIRLLGKIKDTYDGDLKETESSLIDIYSTVDLLAIDDLGKERPNEWALEKLYTIINARYENLLPVVITTNYTIDRLKDRLTVKNNVETAEAIVSRLNEMCVGIEMNWEDWRLKT